MNLIKRFIHLGTQLLCVALFLTTIIDDGMGPLEQHAYYLSQSPYTESLQLSKKQRFKEGLPPDRFHEQIFELTMDPTTGKPDVGAKINTQNRMAYARANRQRAGAVPGQSAGQAWSSVGPNNQAGRVRAALFDDGDVEKDRVIAGGVSGGLWINEDIDNTTDQPWTQVTGVPGNLAVSNIVQDPGNSNIMYVGTGESYTSGDVTGNGIYKSTDGGLNWTQVFGSSSGVVTSTQSSGQWFVNGYFYVNDLVVYDHDNNPATTNWLLAALGDSNHRKMTSTFLDAIDLGLYFSDDEGATWSEISSLMYNATFNEHINDIEIQAVSNRIWLSTTSGGGGQKGGNFYYSDGTSNPPTFTKINFPFPSPWAQNNFGRVEIEPSATTTDTHYILASVSNEAELFKTTDGFATITKLAEPDDVDVDIPAADFTRGQSFYDLEIEADPSNDDIVYVGGIDWHRSTDGGNNWSQITKWSTNNNLAALNVSIIHADQHGLYFRPGSGNNQAVVVNDGGVAYVSSLSTAATNTSAFNEIEGNFVTTQFYRVAQTPPGFAGDDMIFGGTQDNGTYRLTNPGTSGTAGVGVPPGGDGAATFFDQVGGDYAITNYTFNGDITRLNYNSMGQYTGSTSLYNNATNEGDFINVGALDSNLDIYFANSSSGTTYKIRRVLNLTGSTSTSEITGLPNWPTALEVSRHTTNTTTLFVGYRNGTIQKITDANTTASATTLTQPGVGSISDIHLGTTEDDIYVTYYNYGTSSINVFFSDDGGTSWSNKEGNDGVGDLPDIPVYSILNNPFEEEEVIIGTELGVWRTSNFTSANPDWVSAYSGMSDVAVHDLVYRGTSALDNRVVAGTYGRGAYVGSFTANTNPPITRTDSITLAEGGTATTTTGGATSVLANDTDPDGDPITSSVVTNPLHSSAFVVNSNTGTFTYTHDGSETTTDTFFYRAFDGAAYGDTVSVTINITPVNDCPTVDNPISDETAQEDDPDLILDLSNVFSDAENNPLTLTVANANTGLLTATLNTTTLTLDFIDNQTGTATITINVDDNNGCTSTQDTFIVTVVPQNDAPVGVADSIIVNEGGTVSTTSLAATSVLVNDTDTDTANASLTAILNPGTGPYHHVGSFGLMSDGTFTYEHDGSETSTDTFFYNVSDGVSTALTTVTIQINAINDCPTVANPMPDQTLDEDDAGIVPIDLNSVFTDVDIRPMPDTLSFTVTNTNSALGTVTINTATLTLNLINNEYGSMVVTVTANDGSCSTTKDAFTLTVNQVNDPPVSTPNTIRVDEAGTATTTVNTLTSLLDNDSDIDGDTLTALLVSTPTFGTISLLTSGTFTYVHDGSETTTDSFQYKANDGSIDGNTVTVSIIIDGVNDCPVFTATQNYNPTHNEDFGSSSLDFGADTTDPDSVGLSFTTTYTNALLANISLDASTGLLTYTPVQDQFGSLTGTTTVADGSCSINIPFSITFTPVNDCPTVDNPIADINVNEDNADLWIDITSTFSDIESSTLNYSVVSTNNGLLGVSTTATSLVVDFLDDQHGSATIVLTTTDGDPNCTIDDAINVTVNPINDAPVTVSDEISVVSGGTITRLNDGVTTTVLDNDSDADGDTIITDLVTAPLNGTLNLQQNGTFAYTHDGSATTTDVFYYRATDGNLNGNTVSVTIYINNPPVAITETIAVMESGSATQTTDGNTSLLANDTDSDPGDVAALTAVLETNPTHGNLTLNSDGTFIYVHNGNSQPTDSFSYRANDGKVNGAPVTVSITVTGTNDAPIANDDTIIVALNGTATTLDNGSTSFTANDLDDDGDALTITLVSSPTYGTLTLNPGGTFSYVQDGSMNSGDSFTYKVNDGTVDSNNATVNVFLSCSPCTESIVEGGINGVSFTYTDCLCKTVRVYIPKNRAYTFCHLDGSIVVNSGNYTLISSRVCN